MKTWQEYVASGYSLHYVGGSGKSGKYSSFGIANKYEYGKRFFLMVPVNDSVQKEKESEQYFFESPQGTLVREFLEETGVKPLKCRLISTLILTGQEKYLYKIKKFDDSRMFTKPESQRVGPPFWIPEDVVKDAKVIFHAHAWIYLEFMKIGIRIDSSATARVI